MSPEGSGPPGVIVTPGSFVFLRGPGVSHLDDFVAIENVSADEGVSMLSGETPLVGMAAGTHHKLPSVPSSNVFPK